MKNLKRTLFLVSILGFIACDNENITNNNHYYNDETNSLVGNWIVNYTKADEPLYDINKDGKNSTNILEEIDCQYYFLHLNNDFTFIQKNNKVVVNTNSQEYECVEDEAYQTQGLWKVNQDLSQITFIIDGNQVFVPIEFDGKELSFRSSIPFLDKNAQQENKQVYGHVYYKKY